MVSFSIVSLIGRIVTLGRKLRISLSSDAGISGHPSVSSLVIKNPRRRPLNLTHKIEQFAVVKQGI
jgi:hypothetical protein